MPADTHESLLVPEVDSHTTQARLIGAVCNILVVLGIIGNVLGLFIFSLSRRAWRASSVYACLATSSSITNLLCIIRYASIVHLTTRHILHDLVGQIWWACKFYEFSFSFRVISAWITLFWMFERLICVSTKLQSFFQRRCSFKFNFMIPIIIVILILGCVIGPPVYMYQPVIRSYNDTMHSSVNMMQCELNTSLSVQWQRYFHEVHLGMNHFTIRCLFSELIPTGAILVFNSCIIYHIIGAHRHLYQKYRHKSRKEQLRTTSWMNAVLILHSCLFLSSLAAHIIGHFITVEAHEAWWVLLAVLMNCSLNFYIYCLSGKAFRDELRRLYQRFKIRFFNRSQTSQQQSYHNQRFIYELSNLRGPIEPRSNSPTKENK